MAETFGACMSQDSKQETQAIKLSTQGFLHNRRNHCPVFHDVASIAQLAIENWEQLLDFEYSYTVHFEEV